ncbi:FAD-binding oxidoreductase [Streptomyces tropicalis]|uniref:FAD-binding oxidoreductase n=1 Tax=Streptomyces tropicalis TaxID=3034234 RepID=A0ABT6A6W1_9ACTN|nr:FAD-binding oxidoreductase [Streptomyces tropicalis]MDF3300371.1 FAD-binding oxidoreductase [Streptomyces tropicalis]
MSEDSGRSRIEGVVLHRGDAGYETARAHALWNGLTPDRRPDMIVRAACEQDVRHVLKVAASRGLHVAVRAGGHSWCGSPLRDGGVLLDLSGLDRWEIDADSATATVQPGAIGSRFARELARHDLAFPAGHCPSVALGGYLLSGGLGWNSGLWGVGCASVLEVTAVTSDGDVLRCTEEEHPGLFWAARGAGPGFFAVVTRFRLRLQPRPSALATTSCTFPLAAVGPVADWATETARELPANVELSLLLATEGASGATDGPSSKVVVVTATAFANAHPEAVGALHPLRSRPLSERPLSRQLDRPTSLAALYAAATDLWPEKHRYAADTLWSHESYASLLTKLGEAFAEAPSGNSVVLAPVSPVSQEEGLLRNMAFSVLGESYVVPYAVWSDPAHDHVNVRWLREAVRAVEPWGSGHYIAETDLTADPSRARRSFTTADWERLQSVRAEYDPQGLFFSYLSGRCGPE